MAHYDFIQITFSRVKLPAFRIRTGTFFNYNAADTDMVRSLWVAPILTVMTDTDGRWLQISGTYDTAELPYATYGHPAGDRQLRNSLARFLNALLPATLTASQIDYEARTRQSDGLIVLEGKQSFIDQMDSASSHEWIHLGSRRGIAKIMLDEQEITPKRAPQPA